MPVDFISFSPNYNPIVQGHQGTEEINVACKRWSEDLNPGRLSPEAADS